MTIFESLVAHFGGQTKTAEALDVEQGTVSGWVRGKHGMSPLTAMKAEAKTDGLFKAADLCPAMAGLNKPAA